MDRIRRQQTNDWMKPFQLIAQKKPEYNQAIWIKQANKLENWIIKIRSIDESIQRG